MFNLLSQSEQYNLSREYRLRFSAVALFLLGSLGMVALGSLMPSFFLSYQKEMDIAKTFEMLNQDNTSSLKKGLDVILSVAGQKVMVLKDSIAPLNVYQIVADVIHAKPDTVTISGIRATRNKDGGHHVALIGQASNRESLLAFARVLEGESGVTKVTVPVSNFVEAENIKYSIMVETK